MQLVALGILNIVTDVMLLVLPMPVLAKLKAPWRRKAQLLALFTLGFFIIVVTVARLPINSVNKDSQVNRTTWASTELLTSAIVVNAPALYALRNKRKREKERDKQNLGSRGHGRTVGGQRSSPKFPVAVVIIYSLLVMAGPPIRAGEGTTFSPGHWDLMKIDPD